MMIARIDKIGDGEKGRPRRVDSGRTPDGLSVMIRINSSAFQSRPIRGTSTTTVSKMFDFIVVGGEWKSSDHEIALLMIL
jgi:hypothetical protein